MHQTHHNWNINIKDNNNGFSAYLNSSYYGNLDIMKYLESKEGVNIYDKTNDGFDAYLLAIYCDHLEIILHLDTKNWNGNTVDNEGRTAYEIALSEGRVEITEHLKLKQLIKKPISSISEHSCGKSEHSCGKSEHSCGICYDKIDDNLFRCINEHPFHLKCHTKWNNDYCCYCKQNMEKVLFIK